MAMAVHMVNAGHPTTAPVRLAGKVQTVMSVSLYLDVNMVPALMPLNVTAMMGGKGHTAIFQAVATAPMATASIPMNASATMDGQEKIVMLVNPWLVAPTADALIILTPVSVTKDGRAICVTSHLAIWIATMDSVIPQVMELTTFASASLDGGEKAATSAGRTGDAQIKARMLAISPMSVSASTMKQILKAFATTLVCSMSSLMKTPLALGMLV